jgi:hypothetical protein
VATRPKSGTKAVAFDPALKMWLDLIARALVREYLTDTQTKVILQRSKDCTAYQANSARTRKAS